MLVYYKYFYSDVVPEHTNVKGESKEKYFFNRYFKFNNSQIVPYFRQSILYTLVNNVLKFTFFGILRWYSQNFDALFSFPFKLCVIKNSVYQKTLLLVCYIPKLTTYFALGLSPFWLFINVLWWCEKFPLSSSCLSQYTITQHKCTNNYCITGA